MHTKAVSQLRFDYDMTTTQRYHDAFDYDGSDRNYDSTAIRLRQDYDEKIDMLIFLLAWNGNRRARASWSYRGRIVAYIVKVEVISHVLGTLL